jgi:8-oxo-dGTP pyrophosphatase MutT (NUDIX family)
MKEYNFCNNCGKHGHIFHQCKNPITSLGIIVFNNNTKINTIKYNEESFENQSKEIESKEIESKEIESKEIEYLMIRRRDSLGYVDFIRGKYPLFNKRYLLNIINEMTNNEKEKLLTKDFDTLWEELWGDYIGIQYRSEEKTSKEKFTTLNLGITLLYDTYNLESIIKLSNTSWTEPEWGFAKGRRNYNEKDLSCALREFEEETGYDKTSLNLIQNILPLEEIFTGSNYKSYKHKYYLAKLDKQIQPVANFQKSEVSKVQWLTFNECLKKIRPYNLERIDILKKANHILTTYNFY